MTHNHNHTVKFWSLLLDELIAHKKVCLLYVLKSVGSSPGRQGFKQFVTSEGKMFGSIGGGVMEKKLVDLAIELMANGHTEPLIKHQIHQTNIEKNKSGMICSGEQTVAYYFLKEQHINLVRIAANASSSPTEVQLVLDENDFLVVNNPQFESANVYNQLDEVHWNYHETINRVDEVFIIGGGHVSLALSQCIYQLEMNVHVFDDRNNLNTMDMNVYAKSKYFMQFDEAVKLIPEGNSSYVVLMTTGYRTDLSMLRLLLKRNYKYIGVLGSEEKIRKMFSELIQEGFSHESLSRVKAPIGLSIWSKTPAEIAVSIAAQIIAIKNQ